MRKRWRASFGPDKEIWTLSEMGDVHEYLTRDKPDGNPFGRKPTFHVWKGDEWLYCGSSREKADAVFAEAVKEENSERPAGV